MSDTPSEDLSVFGKVIAVGIGLIVLNFVGLVAIIVVGILDWQQSVDNERHIDCIVASAAPVPPERCVDIIADLREDGILRPPPILTTEP